METPVVSLQAHRESVEYARTSSRAAAVEELAPRSSVPPGPGARARRATRARAVHDGWTFVVIPPGAGALPRTLRVSVRRLRMVTIAFGTIVGTGIVSGSLLAVLLSMAPVIQPETAGIRLGVLGDGELPVAVVSDSAALMMTDAASSSGAAVSGEAAGGARGVTKTRSSASKPAAPRRRVIERPSMSGERRTASSDASVAEARALGLPVIGRITSRFSNARTHPLLGVVRRHNGVDIAAPSGTPITAAAAGRVIFAGRKFGFGNTVEIDHGNGVITRYAHARTIKVRGGARVEPGTTIATVGRTGLASGPHLHFEVLLNGTSVDPLKRPVSSLLGGAASETAGESSPSTPEPATAIAPAAGVDSTAAAAGNDSLRTTAEPSPAGDGPAGSGDAGERGARDAG